MLANLTTTLFACTLGLCLVLMLRRGVRRMCGAATAYALWILPLAMGLASWIPARHATQAPPLRAARAMVAVVHDAAATMQGQRFVSMVLAALWMAGTAVMLARLVTGRLRLHREMKRCPDHFLDRIRGDWPAHPPSTIRLHGSGPAVLWSGRTLLLLPEDFAERFTARERRLVLAHECMHVRRRDAYWNLLAEVMLAGLWFHPLAWFARSRFRLDQELACDEAILRRFPGAARPYAHTLMHGTGHAGTPVLATWREAPQLKERLTMIRQFSTRKPLRRMAVPVLAVLFAGGVLSAQAMGSLGTPPGVQPPSASMKFRLKSPPVYPAYAIKHHLEGNVILRVKVNAHGEPVQVIPESGKADPSLVKAAITAAKNWRYHPATKHGKPVVGWAKIPVYFRLGKDSGTQK
jgi:TonB family protein